MTKILEKIIEPGKVVTGSIFKLKIKAIRYITFKEMKQQKVKKMKEFKVADLKGVGK